MHKMSFPKISCLLLLCLLWALPASAQSPDSKPATPEAKPAAGGNASQFGGPTSVGGILNRDREAEAAVSVGEEGLVDPYLDFKKRIEKTYGLAFGFDYSALIQTASQSPGEDTAAGGVFRAFGHWTLVGRDTEDTGMLVYKVENRHRLGTDIAPKGLGFETGYVGVTALTFSDIGWALTNLCWYQRLLGNRFGFVAGVVDSTDYVDVYSLLDPWNDFSNLAFLINPTIPLPNQGLGAAARVLATDNVYLLGGVADTNGDPTDPGNSINSFFSEAEYLTHIEIGWIASFEKRVSDNIHLTAWHADERKKALVPDGWGVAFSFNRLIADKWEPFVRAGYAEDGGALWERSVSMGLGYHTRKKSDMIGLGLNWSRPNEDTFGPGLDDQYTAEIYYRLQVLKVLAVTPDVQVLFNPALNPDEDVIFVFGLRGRISF